MIKIGLFPLLKFLFHDILFQYIYNSQIYSFVLHTYFNSILLPFVVCTLLCMICSIYFLIKYNKSIPIHIKRICWILTLVPILGPFGSVVSIILIIKSLHPKV